MKQSERSIRVVVTGDLAFGGEFLQRARPKGEDFRFNFRPALAAIGDADVVLVNLEGPIGTDGPVRSETAALLHNSNEVLDWLCDLPLSICNLANNHMMDYGCEALLRTQELLKSRGIYDVGAGRNNLEAQRALLLNIDGFRLGVVSFTTDEPHVGSILAEETKPGACGMPNADALCGQVSTLAQQTDAVIVLLHWGHEYYQFPSPNQVDLSRRLAKAGARLVVGHHPHVPQGYERIGNSLVCYSLGNFLLPEQRSFSGRVQYRKPVSRQFLVLSADIGQSDVKEWQFVGGRWNRRYQLIPDERCGRERLDELSKPLQSTNYLEFWKNYQNQREFELQREALKEAFAKIWNNDWRTIKRTFSGKDIARNFRRVRNSLLPSRY